MRRRRYETAAFSGGRGCDGRFPQRRRTTGRRGGAAADRPMWRLSSNRITQKLFPGVPYLSLSTPPLQAASEDNGAPGGGFEKYHRQGDTDSAQMLADIGVYYAPSPLFRGEQFDGSEAVHQLEECLIQNHGYQPQYSVSELSETNFWGMFDRELYENCRSKYKAVGTFMDVYYKSKKGKKTEKEVREAEAAVAEVAVMEEDNKED